MANVSIIVPIYKVEAFLRKCIDSIIAQTYKDIEIILVDDGSPDNCAVICDEYVLKDNRIKVIHQKNSGLSEARNAGIKIATGKYIGFVDSDDYIATDMYEKLVELIENAKADLAICNYQYVDIKGNILFNISPMKNEILNKEDMFKKLEENNYWYYVTAWNKLYKRELFKNIKFPKGKIQEDEFIIHEIFYECNKIVTTHDIYYYYVQRTNSIMSEKITVRKVDAIEALYNRYLFYKKHAELEKYLLYMRKRVWEVYVYIITNVSIHDSTDRKRLKEAKIMFKEIYKGTFKQKFSKKEYLKYIFPEFIIILIKLRKRIKEI